MIKKILIFFIFIGCLITALYFIHFYSNKHTALKEQTSSVIDSLISSSEGNTDQINRLSHMSDSLKSKIKRLREQVATIDSLKEWHKQENTREVEKLSDEKLVLEKTIFEYNRDSANCTGEIERLNEIISNLKREIELLHSRHDIPVLFMLHSSLKYYYTDSLEKVKIITELNRIIGINNWQETCEQIYSKIDQSSKSQYQSIKLVGQKAGCPFPASYLLIKEHGFDPETIEEDEFLTLIKAAINSFQRDFRYCSSQVKTLFISEDGTLQRIKDTILCLKQNLEI
jgi:hypothetical protein